MDVCYTKAALISLLLTCLCTTPLKQARVFSVRGCFNLGARWSLCNRGLFFPCCNASQAVHVYGWSPTVEAKPLHLPSGASISAYILASTSIHLFICTHPVVARCQPGFVVLLLHLCEPFSIACTQYSSYYLLARMMNLFVTSSSTLFPQFQRCCSTSSFVTIHYLILPVVQTLACYIFTYIN